MKKKVSINPTIFSGRSFKISGKTVQVFNNNPIPKKSVIKKAYDKIPDDTSIPLQFMTRKQYMNKYIKNQEHINGTDFPIEQEKAFIKQRTPHYANITGRYTTRNNPYYPPAVVVFNDKNNLKNIKGDNFAKLAWHEYGHELVEKKNIKLPLHKEEYFADRVADIGTSNKIFCDNKAKNQIFDEMFERKTDRPNRTKDIRMANIYQERFPEKDTESLNKFTAHPRYEQAQELTAAQKFGGKNLQGLKKLGQGRDRIVYALDDDKVLKVAKNPGGLTQNTGETDLQFLGMGQQLEEGKDYVVMQRQQPLTKQSKQKLAKVRKTVAGIDGDEHKKRVALSADDSVLDQTGITRDILNYDYNSSELFANRQWGEDEQGNPVLVDGGALQDDVSLRRYRVKDFQQVHNMDPERSPWQLKEWQDIQNQRRQFKDKGSFDKDRKFNKGYLEGDLDNNVILEDDYSENMAEFSIEQEKEIYGLDWNKDQRGKKIGEGHFGRVYEVKDNPNYILKTSKQKEDHPKNYLHGNITDIDREQYKYEQFKDKQIIAPTIKTKQGLVREKLNIATRGVTKQDWQNKDKDSKVKGLLYIENDELTDEQAKNIVSGVNELSDDNVLIDDELQIGISPTDNKPYIYDIGTFRKQKENKYDGFARDENDQYKQRFLKAVKKEKYFDRDYEQESEAAIKEINNIKTDDDSKNDKIYFPRKLKEQGISFDTSLSPKKQRILTKILRKNPELLIKKGTSKVELGLNYNRTAFGTTEPVIEKERDKTYLKFNEYKVGFNKNIFNQKYDPNFVDYVSRKKDIYQPSEEILEEERNKLPRQQKLHSSKHDIPRTLSHEFEHVKQIEGFGGNIAEFKEKYDKEEELYGYNVNRYEFEARKAAEEQADKRMDRKITEGVFTDEWNYKEPEEITDDEWTEMTTRKEPQPDNYSENKQVLWRAGNELPSENLEKEGRVFGFSSIDYAKGWKEKKGYSNIYSFATDDYELDEKNYLRPLEGKKKKMSDNEYIAKNVISEQKIE